MAEILWIRMVLSRFYYKAVGLWVELVRRVLFMTLQQSTKFCA